eukprot:GHVU01143861.1.p1 GENE.GHVU01143861.1~~GHVU01143861.1.p1  ORF type:complete len:104 (+),score=5.48 GHVU01143861.1:87-398(+)
MVTIHYSCLYNQSPTLHTNIPKKCQIASLNLNKIKKLRKFLTMDACRTIVQALVISHIDYGNSLYYGLPNTELSRLQRIQNYAAKIICTTEAVNVYKPYIGCL